MTPCTKTTTTALRRAWPRLKRLQFSIILAWNRWGPLLHRILA